ncbi:MAG: aminoacyl-tRNA hydrolase, partial [Duodenibacillus sp.]|nr:aminoacyl-tRNA hydrolase [Duodenibacillus sp.]
MKPIRLIAGLGNPGPEYRGTRHNMGYEALDAIARACGVRFSPDIRFFGEVARLRTGDGEAWLVKPTTYMNLSGSSVQALAAYYKIAPDEILVIHDELDLPPGAMRAKLGGGNAGHNGLKSIAQRLSTPGFWRLRIGIGHPRAYCPQQQVADWVLGQPLPEHAKAAAPCIEAAEKLLPAFLSGDEARLGRMLRKFEPPKPPKPAKAPGPEAGPGPEGRSG